MWPYESKDYERTTNFWSLCIDHIAHLGSGGSTPKLALLANDIMMLS